jgi:hypothetical protein
MKVKKVFKLQGMNLRCDLECWVRKWKEAIGFNVSNPF